MTTTAILQSKRHPAYRQPFQSTVYSVGRTRSMSVCFVGQEYSILDQQRMIYVPNGNLIEPNQTQWPICSILVEEICSATRNLQGYGGTLILIYKFTRSDYV